MSASNWCQAVSDLRLLRPAAPALDAKSSCDVAMPDYLRIEDPISAMQTIPEIG